MDPDTLKSVFQLNRDFLKFFLICIAFDMVVFSLVSMLKWHWLKRARVSLDDRVAIFSNRKRGFSLSKLLEKYSERQLMIIDGVCRKLMHSISGLILITVITYFMDNPMQSAEIFIARNIFLLTVFAIFRNSNELIGFGGVIFGGCARIRDGVFARKNLMIVASVLVVMGCWSLGMVYYLVNAGVSIANTYLLYRIIFLPMMVGDALGEIMGSLFGKQTIKVRGVGEINKKSWVGTLAIFLGSAASLLILLGFHEVADKWYGLIAVVTLSSTVVELLSPRSTDNFFVPATNSIICVIFAHLYLLA